MGDITVTESHMIRALHVSPVGMKTGGTEQAIHALCQLADRSRERSFLWTPHGGGATLDAMLQEAVLADVTLTLDPSELADFLNRHAIQIAIVHSGSLYPWYARPPFGTLTESRGLPVVEVVHREHRAWGTEFGIDVIVTVSPHVAAIQDSTPPTPIITIPNGISLEEFRGSHELTAPSRERWGIPQSAVVLGFFGRLVEEKGPQDVLEIVKTLTKRFQHVWFLIGGDGTLRTQLQVRISSGDFQRAICRSGERQGSRRFLCHDGHHAASEPNRGVSPGADRGGRNGSTGCGLRHPRFCGFFRRIPGKGFFGWLPGHWCIGRGRCAAMHG